MKQKKTTKFFTYESPLVRLHPHQQKQTVLYIGVTNDLKRRVYEHKNKLIKGFTFKYNVYNPIYYELFQNINEAIQREKRLKEWKRVWKEELINNFNPEWKDLWDEI